MNAVLAEALIRLAVEVSKARALLQEYARTDQVEEEVVAKLHPVVKRIAEAFLEAHDLVTKGIH